MRTPVEVSDELFAQMKEQFTDEQLVEIIRPLPSSGVSERHVGGSYPAGLRRPLTDDGAGAAEVLE